MTRIRTRREFCELGAATALAFATGCADDDPATEGGASNGSSGTDPTSTSTGTTGVGTDDSSGATQSSSMSTDASGSSSSAADSSDSGSSVGGSSDGSSSDSGETEADLCEPSPPSIEGPFYRPGTPIRGDLDLYGDAGIAVHLHGRVLDTDCTPVVDAVVEIWHATPVTPDGMPGDFDALYDDGRQFRYYGQVATDDAGNYAFDTLQPGWYLNGAMYRPAHIHLKIWVGAAQRLVTQLYFEDDPFAEDDPWFDPTMVLVLDDAGDVERDFVI
jgi:protocatechuate 3,4-dioxygenase beta subunit